LDRSKYSSILERLQTEDEVSFRVSTEAAATIIQGVKKLKCKQNKIAKQCGFPYLGTLRIVKQKVPNDSRYIIVRMTLTFNLNNM